MSTKTISIRAVDQFDHEQWLTLYQGYIAFYQRKYDDQKVATLWQWLTDKLIFGLVAEQDGKLVGLAHYREMPSPLNGFMVGFLDDLFIEPNCRGSEVATGLMSALKEQAQVRGWPFIRWITHENNYRAKAFYDKISNKTLWNTYQMDCL